MYQLNLQYFEIFLKSVKSAHFNEIVYNISESIEYLLVYKNIKIVMLQWNILQYLTTILRQYFNCNERLEIFLTCFCNILCYVGEITKLQFYCIRARNRIFFHSIIIQELIEKSFGERKTSDIQPKQYIIDHVETLWKYSHTFRNNRRWT